MAKSQSRLYYTLIEHLVSYLDNIPVVSPEMAEAIRVLKEDLQSLEAHS